MKKVIFIGKGGVGKTTILSILCKLLAYEGHKVLLIDCDPSMNLAMSLGIPFSRILSLTEDKSQLQEKLSSSLEEVDAHHEDQDLSNALRNHRIKISEGIELLVMGTVPHGGSGCLCAPVSLVKMLVSRLAACGDQEFIMVDSPAGVEILGRGLSSEFDLSLVITEPTPKSMDVAKHSLTLAKELGIKRRQRTRAASCGVCKALPHQDENRLADQNLDWIICTLSPLQATGYCDKMMIMSYFQP